MKLPSKKRVIYKRPTTWLVIVCVIVAGFIILEKTHVIDFFNTPPTDSVQGPTPEQQQLEDKLNTEKKKDFIENTNQTGSPSETPPPSTTSLELSAKRETNNTVTVFTKLYGYSDGTCELTITNGGKTVSQRAEVIYQPEFASCAGFSVPIDPLGKGAWNIKLSVSSSGNTQEKTISFEVR